MKVLWMSNCVLGNSISNGSGSWLHAMSHLIKDSVELTNVAKASVDKITYNSYDSFNEILVPSFSIKNDNIANDIANIIHEVVEHTSPDIIHIWGVEGDWAYLYAKGYIIGNVVLEIQGLMEPCYNVFWGGLEPRDIIHKSLCVRKLLYPKTRLSKRRQKFKIIGEQTETILKECHFVSTQSNWVRDQIMFSINDKCKIYKTLRPIRQDFWEAKPWHHHNGTCKIFTSMSYYLPFKGIHVLIYAISLLKKKYRNVMLEIAGIEQKDLIWYRQFEYIKYLQKLSKKLDVVDNVKYVGRLTAQQIVEHLQGCDVFVNPSFVESYSASTAEALALGVPTVVAYAGAMPDFSENIPVSLYYSPMDYVACAAMISSFIENEDMREELSTNSKREIQRICGSDSVRKVQLSIYEDLLSRNKK